MAASFPPNPSPGEMYTYNGKTWRWNGDSWGAVTVPTPAGSPVYVSMSPPPSPVEGSLWYDSLNNSLNIYCTGMNGSGWIAVVPYPQDSITQQGGIFEGAIYSQYEIPNNPAAFVTAAWVDALVDPLVTQVNNLQAQVDLLTAQQASTQSQLDALQIAFDNYVATHP